YLRRADQPLDHHFVLRFCVCSTSQPHLSCKSTPIISTARSSLDADSPDHHHHPLVHCFIIDHHLAPNHNVTIVMLYLYNNN
ncbi:hypothetical protein RDWZM_004726, partial [Blomia tropicalis]